MSFLSCCRWSLFVCTLLLFCVCTPAKTLKIASTPPGATIELDGQVVGKTPYEQDFPSGYFQRPMTALQKRLEHPIHLRLTLSGYVTQELVITLGPKDWLDLHRRSHGQYWLFKSDEFHIDLPPLPPSPHAAAAVVTSSAAAMFDQVGFVSGFVAGQEFDLQLSTYLLELWVRRD